MMTHAYSHHGHVQKTIFLHCSAKNFRWVDIRLIFSSNLFPYKSMSLYDNRHLDTHIFVCVFFSSFFSFHNSDGDVIFHAKTKADTFFDIVVIYNCIHESAGVHKSSEPLLVIGTKEYEKIIIENGLKTVKHRAQQTHVTYLLSVGFMY